LLVIGVRKLDSPDECELIIQLEHQDNH